MTLKNKILLKGVSYYLSRKFSFIKYLQDILPKNEKPSSLNRKVVIGLEIVASVLMFAYILWPRVECLVIDYQIAQLEKQRSTLLHQQAGLTEKCQDKFNLYKIEAYAKEYLKLATANPDQIMIITEDQLEN